MLAGDCRGTGPGKQNPGKPGPSKQDGKQDHGKQDHGKQGLLRMRFGVKEGRTVIRDMYNQVPLKVAKPFYLEPESGEIFIYQMNPAGGMVQGDDYSQEIELDHGSRVFLTTQSATKIYRTPDSRASQRNLFVLGQNALLEYFPDPVIPFAGSEFANDTEVHLTGGAIAFLAEIVTPGRTKRDEVFLFSSYKSKTRVYWDEELILWDNWHLQPETGEVRALGMFEGYTHYGNLLIFSEKVEQSLADSLHGVLLEFPDVLGSASLTVKNGIAVRILGRRTDRLEQAVGACWDAARRKLVGSPKPHIRKY